MKICKKTSLGCREKIIRWGGMTLYHRRSAWEGGEQNFLGIPITRRVRTVEGVRRYILGIYVGTKASKDFRRPPAILPAGEYMRLKHSEPKELLIVAPFEGMGDYILMRNLLGEIKKTEKYKDYRITLVCGAYYQLAKYLDSDVVDEILPMKVILTLKLTRNVKDEWRRTEASRQALIKEGLKPYYDTILYCDHVLFCDDERLQMYHHLVSHVVSRERIEFEYERCKVRPLLFHSCTRVVMGYFNGKSQFVFSTWKGYFEEFLERAIELPYPVIETEKIPNKVIKEGRYIVVNPCSSKARQDNMWHRNNWVELLQRLGKKEKLSVILAVSKSQASYVKRLRAELTFEGINAEVMAGLNTEDLMALLNGAELYIGLDSGLFHLAAAMGKKAVCISSGAVFDRWLRNYEMRPAQLRVVLPPNWRARYLEEMTDEERLAFSYRRSTFPINAVRVEDVEAEAHDLLHLQNAPAVSKSNCDIQQHSPS